MGLFFFGWRFIAKEEEMFGMFFAIIGTGFSLVVIIICLIVLAEKAKDFIENRWEWVRKKLVDRMIFRFRMHGDYTYEELGALNRDIDRMNYLFRKYRLDDPFDKEERQFIRKFNRENTFETRR